MLKTVLWIAAACAAVLVALAVSRTLNFDEPVKAPEPPPAAVAPAPVEAPPPPPAPEVKDAPPPLTPDEQQIQDDAAATGMTTMEPEPPAEPPTN
jgi:hypothetical protein